jgi:hypothetical protein
MLVRATTTTNAQGRRQRFVLPSTYKSNEIDIDYLQALKVFIYFSSDYSESLAVEFRLSKVVNDRFISLISSQSQKQSISLFLRCKTHTLVDDIII